MGFLKFLKKEKKEKMLDESLDVPPPPPSIKEELPEIPKFEEEKPLPKEFPPFEFKEEKPIPAEEKLPEMPKEPKLEIPGFPPLEEEYKFVPKPPMKEPVMEPLPKKELIKPELREAEDIFREEKRPSNRELVSKGPTYVRLDKFKGTLKSLNKIRSDLKKSDKFLHDLIKSKEEKDKDFEKWHTIMEDIQKKLIFIEKTLFK